MFVSYSDLPGFQNLSLDYLYEFENVKRFFRHNFRDTDSYPEIIDQCSASENRADRTKVVQLIRDSYRGFQISKQTESNLNSLTSNKTIAVVTGQQLTIFGGPMYTFYKIITTVKLCRHLKEKFEDYNFVPVFWLEGDDHDYNEIASINIFDLQNNLKKIQFGEEKEPDDNRGSVGEIKLGDQITSTINDLDESLRESEFKSSVMDLIKNCYTPEDSLKSSFRKMLFEIFDEYGLIIFDPQTDGIKSLLKPIFSKEIDEFRTHTDQILTRSAELEDAYHAQVKIKPINLFINEEGGRYLIEPVEDEFRLKGKRIRYTKEQLLSLIENTPERFSPNVLLRPICQDYLLPTAFYVAGPSEISYFGQVMPYYDIYDIPAPVVYPRASATILENPVASVLEKYDLNFVDSFLDEKDLNTKVLSEVADTDVEELFRSVDGEIEKIMLELKDKITDIDKTLEDTTNKTYQRINQSLTTLKDKTTKAQERQHDMVIRQLAKLRINVYPGESLQERKINFVHFVNKYGLDILKWIYSELSFNKFEHQILEL